VSISSEVIIGRRCVAIARSQFSRRDFIRTLGLAGGAGALGMLGGAAFLKGCADQERVSRQEEVEDWQPAYQKLEDKGKLKERVEQAFEKLKYCELCPRRCGVNRLNGETGFCNTTDKVVVHGYTAHFGEERPLVGNNGSGTIFFSNCNLRCVFCQNWPIAHKGRGDQVSDEEIASMMIELQNRGCHNINLVTPTHIMPNLLNATRKALNKGLHLPLCYNTGGYELKENMELLDGIADIYLPDLKFMDEEMFEKYSVKPTPDYPQKAQESIIEMHRQVGDVIKNQEGHALSGLMVRHLVMPNRVSNPKKFVEWFAENLSKDTYVNIMAQYRVEYKAYEYEKINRAITSEEFIEAIEWAKEAGLTNLDERSLERYEIHRDRSN